MSSSPRNIFWSLMVRAILMCHTFVAFWRTIDITDKTYYWYLLLLNVWVLAETFYRIKVRRGKEGKWFCPCFLLYLICTVPAIYILELDRLERYNEVVSSLNITIAVSLSNIQGVSLPITLSPDIWVSVIEQSMLFLMILARWLLPRGDLSRDQLSQLLFVYIGMGSDNMELFVLFEESPVRRDRILTYCILAIWTVSLLQFSVVLTATRKTNSVKKRRIYPTGVQIQEAKKDSLLDRCLKTELWSLLLTFVCQDGPYLTVRLYAMVTYKLVTYSIIFFTCKNCFMIGLLLYRLFAMRFDKDGHESPKDSDTERTKPRVSQPWARRHPGQSTSGGQRLSIEQVDDHYSSVKGKNGRQSYPKSKGSKKLSVLSLDL